MGVRAGQIGMELIDHPHTPTLTVSPPSPFIYDFKKRSFNLRTTLYIHITLQNKFPVFLLLMNTECINSS